MGHAISWRGLCIALGIVCAAAVFMAVGWRGSQTGINSIAASVSVECSENGQNVYAADLNGVHVSRDYGKTWTTHRPGQR